MSLRDQDKLGRRAKWRRQAKRAERTGDIDWRAFELQAGRDEISVDRLDVVSDDEIAKIAMREFNERFFGWYVLTVLDVNSLPHVVSCS